MIPGDEGWESLGPIHGRRRGDIDSKLIQKDGEVGKLGDDTSRDEGAGELWDDTGM